MTWDRKAAGPSFDGGGAAREAELGAEQGREREDLGVTAGRCRDAAWTTLALSMTGLSAIYDPKKRVSVLCDNKSMQEWRAEAIIWTRMRRKWLEKEPTFDGAKLTTRSRKLRHAARRHGIGRGYGKCLCLGTGDSPNLVEVRLPHQLHALFHCGHVERPQVVCTAAGRERVCICIMCSRGSCGDSCCRCLG